MRIQVDSLYRSVSKAERCVDRRFHATAEVDEVGVVRLRDAVVRILIRPQEQGSLHNKVIFYMKKVTMQLAAASSDAFFLGYVVTQRKITARVDIRTHSHVAFSW